MAADSARSQCADSGSSDRPEVRAEAPSAQQVLVVLGMHRSGTSALAGTLGCLGVDLGRSLMPADEESNPTGFWENERIVEIHERLFQGLGYEWNDVRLLPDGWLARETVLAQKRAIVQVIAKEFGDCPVWGIKDPRLCRFLPLWQEIFAELGLRAVYVHVFRHPMEVAMSLERRDGFGHADSLLLWTLYNIESMRNTQGEPRVFLEYQSLVRDWRSPIAEIGRALDLRWPKPVEKAAGAIDRFLSADLYHNRVDPDSPARSDGMSRYVFELYDLLRAAGRRDAAATAVRFEDFSIRFTAAADLFKPWQSISEQLSAQRLADMECLAKGLREAQQWLAERNRYIGRLEVALSEAQDIVGQRNRKLEKVERKLEETKAMAMQRLARIEVLDAGLNEAQQIVGQQNERIERLDAGLRQAQRLVAERNEYVARLEPALAEAQRIVQRQNDEILRLNNHPLLRLLRSKGD